MSAAPAEAVPSPAAGITQALAHYQEGRFADAETRCTAILAAEPEHFDALHLLGLVRHRQKRNAEALQLVGAVLKRAPRSAEVSSNYGLIVAALGYHDEALGYFDHALACDAADLYARKNRAASLKQLSRHAQALAAYEAVLEVKSDDIDALNECGGLQARLGHAAAAVDCYDRALALAPSVAELHINKGMALSGLNRFDEALQSFAAAAAIAPDRAEAHHKASLIRLRLGDFKNGWRDYEWRWRTARPPQSRQVAAPLWRGDTSLKGKTIFLLSEQGLGDTIQFLRYAPLVAARGATVLLDVPPELKTMAARLSGVAAVFAHGEPAPSADYQCPLLSLPLAFQTEPSTIPSDVPYIRAGEPELAKWRARLPNTGRPLVGLCWAGSATHLNDHNRSIALERFAALLAVPGVDFVSVQKDVSAGEAARLASLGVAQLGRDFADFADTAGALALLDLLISVDTSVAHLAGALAKPVALLLPFSPDWRWMQERTDSPWYPTFRLFRQSRSGDWDSPLDRLRGELQDAAATPKR